MLHGATGVALAFGQPGRDQGVDNVQTGVERRARRLTARHVGENLRQFGVAELVDLGAEKNLRSALHLRQRIGPVNQRRQFLRQTLLTLSLAGIGGASRIERVELVVREVRKVA